MSSLGSKHDARVRAADPHRLLAWYRDHRRELPWRSDTDPYRVLVSEVMLQQTRVEVVIPRFKAFLRRFPTLETLAAADVDAVVAEWSGLGYYRRARALHQSAREIVRRGAWPRTVSELKHLPGIGEYTAAAVASIAFGEPEVALDGNVKRLAARLSADGGELGRAATHRRLRRVAAAWLDPELPGDGNQALMELGATVCEPRPHCDRCPLTAACQAFAAGEPTRYPATSTGKPAIAKHWRLAAIRRSERVWLVRRPASAAWLPEVFELPWVDEPAEDQEAASRISAKYGVTIEFRRRIGSVRHAIGRRAITADVWRAELARSSSATPPEYDQPGGNGRWVDLANLSQVATSSLVSKALSIDPDGTFDAVRGSQLADASREPKVSSETVR